MIVALDCETTGVGWHDPVIGFSTYDGESAEWWPRSNFEGLREYLSEANTIIMHNAKFDLQKAILEEVWPSHGPTVIDTEALAHLLDEHRRKGLKTLAKDILGKETDEADKLKAVRKELGLTKADGFGQIPEEILIPYALKDAEHTYELYVVLWPFLVGYPEVEELFWKEMELTWALLEMEAHGMALDMEYVESRAKFFAGQGLALELEIRDMLGDEEFNPRSPKQVMEAFDARGIKLKDTKEATLAKVGDPLADKIVELRKSTRLYTHYFGPMLDEQVDGIIHVNIRQHGTVTGRVSSGEVDRE